ncbi:MAG: acetyltransferase [Clostridia bacterium]|jgi:RimJ/RimL family protein N-acetyltransferase|nr:acetyltransferase [Clostridia bacterium]
MLTGKNIRLREVRKEDLPVINELGNEEEVIINLTTRIPAPTPLGVDESWYEDYTKKYDGNFVQFVIEKLDGTVIGKCGTMGLDWKDACTTVWIFIGKPENRGKGYGTEALKLFVDFAFMEMNLNRVQLLVFDFNKRAISSYEKVGFVVEGIYKQEVYRNGSYHDVYQMGILRKEYDMRQRG